VADTEAIVEQLRDIEEQLRDLAYDRLRAAAEHGDDDAEREERKLLQARRAVEKAIHVLTPAEAADPFS
jgi:hypothetical protein